jgi:hypothetical protein
MILQIQATERCSMYREENIGGNILKTVADVLQGK